MDFNSLVDQNHAYLLYYLRRFKLSSEVESDLLQETWLAFLEKPDGFQGKSTLRTYLASILTFKVYGWFKAQKKYVEVDSDLMDKMVENQFVEDGHWKELARKNPFEHLEQKELLEKLENCKEELNPLQKMVLAMKEAGLSGKEMSQAVEKTEANLRLLIFRLNHQLRFCLEGYFK